MSDVDKEISGRYREASRDEPPAHLDAAILAAAKRAAGSQPHPAGAPRPMRRWYVPVSIAAVLMLSVAVTLRMEREQPDIAMPDSVPVLRDKAKQLAQAPEPPAPAAPPVAAAIPAQKPSQAQPAAPAFAPDPKPARDAPPAEKLREDSPRAADAAGGPAASGEASRSNAAAADSLGRLRSEAREMSAPAPAAPKPAAESDARQKKEDAPRVAESARDSQGVMSAPAAALAKRQLAPDEWLERIAELRRLRRDQEADEQFAEFKRRYPDYRIPDSMTERIAPRK